ncbi:MAG: SRPBCC family protein [Deltaproteobacteria bacterium]|nr:SRPBCC family protein [Deltaproteobacteria bacterium]
MREIRALPAAAFAALALLVPITSAASAPGGFSEDEMKLAAGLLARHGVVVLAETTPEGGPKAMTLAVLVNAPREEVFKVFENPENFSFLSSLFKENKVEDSHGSSKAWTWASRHKLFSFTGTNTISLFPPRRVDIQIVNSTIGSGTFRFDLRESGKDRTLLVLSGILGVKSSDWIIRYLLGGNPAMQQAMNVAIGIVVVKGAKDMAERMVRGKPLGKRRVAGPAGGETRPCPAQELVALAPLLARGMVVLVDENKGGRLRQITAVESVAAPAARVLAAVSTPELYPKMVKAISDVKVGSKTDEATEFSWTLGFSVFNLSSRNRMTRTPDGVAIDGLDGDFAGARWRWQLAGADAGHTIVAYHGFVNIDATTYVLKMSLKREPYLEHGIMAGSNMVMLRAVRRAVEAR